MISDQMKMNNRIDTSLGNIIQLFSGITRGRVLNLVLYTQRFQELSYLHLFS